MASAASRRHLHRLRRSASPTRKSATSFANLPAFEAVASIASPGTSSSPVGASGASTPPARSRACCRRTARASGSSTTSTSCSTRRCCPGAAAGVLEPRHVVVPLREQLPVGVDLRLGRIIGATPERNSPAGREPRGLDRGPLLRPAHRHRRVGQPHAADPRPRRARPRASSRCPRRSRCATTSCARSSTPRRSRTAPRAAST